MVVKAKLVIEVSAEFTDDEENNADTLRYCVEQDLEDNGFSVDSCEVIDGTEEIEFEEEEI